MALQVQFWTISGLSVELRMNIRTDPCNKVPPDHCPMPDMTFATIYVGMISAIYANMNAFLHAFMLSCG